MRRSLITFGVLTAVLLTTTFKQAVCQNQQEGATPAAAMKPSGPVLLEDTPIKLRIAQTISSGTSKVNDKVDFEVVEDVKVGDVVVIPQGGTAIATVTEAQPKRRLGRSGKLNINIDYARLVNGDKAPLRAVKGGSGGGRTGVMTAGIVATAIVFFPAAPFFLFMKGKNIIIPKGTEITAYVAADTPVGPIAPPAGQTEVASNAATPQPESAPADSSAVVVKSNPDGAEITVDGKFMGTTQSTLRLPSGEHTVKIEKSGYKQWTRSITLSAGGDITIDAALEKSPQ
jgi:PEGA domain